MKWPHSWVAYFAGCECDQCKDFDARVFERGVHPTAAAAAPEPASDGPTIVAMEGA